MRRVWVAQVICSLIAVIHIRLSVSLPTSKIACVQPTATK
jgi:hypothetical protein